MSTWTVTSSREPWFNVQIGESDRAHADSVLAQLLVEPSVPSDLTLTENVPAPPDPPKKRRWRLGGRS